MISFHGKRVSRSWLIVLTEAARHFSFQLNSGQRTMAEQQHLVDTQGVWSPSNPHGAARPSPNAPHIRVGRQAHAVDVDSAGDGENKLQRWLIGLGVSAVNTVPGEPWHLEVPELQLIRLAARLKLGRPLRRGAKRSPRVWALKRRLRKLGYFKGDGGHSGFGKRLQLAVLAFQNAHGLTPDGIVGPATQRAIKAALKRGERR